MPIDNAIRVIAPYRFYGAWVFDDPAVRLEREPFVSGADEVMDVLAQELGGVDSMLVYFSPTPFPDALHATAIDPDVLGGATYEVSEMGRQAWLCPALFRYFDEVPPDLWFKAKRQASASADSS